MPFKTIGLVFIFIVCTAAGFLKSLTISKRVKELEAFCGAFAQISTEIRYFASPTDVIMKKLESMSEYKNLKVFTYCKEELLVNRNFQSSWKKAVEKAVPYLSINKDDAETIKRFGESFGTTDVEGQTANCEEYSSLLNKRLDSARADKASRGKMYTSLGILAGIFFTIFFI